MDDFLKEPEPEKGINKILLVAAAVGILVIIALIGITSLKPSPRQLQEDALAGAYREGSPEFALYTKKIVAQTSEDRTTQSPTGMGTWTMFIGGTLRNITGKTITGLEIKVAVVDMAEKVVKEKVFTVVPNVKREVSELPNNQILPVQVTIEGIEQGSDRANIRWKVTAIKVKE